MKLSFLKLTVSYKQTFLILPFLLSLMMGRVACGFGVGSPGACLDMYPGETQIVNLTVSNGGGATEAIDVTMTMTWNDANIASFPDMEFTLDAGAERLVPLTITVPFDAEIGYVYGMCVDSLGCFVDPNGEGGIGFCLGVLNCWGVCVRAPTISIDEVALSFWEGDEGETSFDFRVNLSRPIGRPVTVNYFTEDGTATAEDSDYEPINGTLIFEPNEIGPKTISVLVNGDTKIESDEVFYLKLSNATNAVITEATAVGTIEDDDGKPRYLKIQHAIDSALDGDTIVVPAGVYRGVGNREINFKGKAITVRSIDPNHPDVVAATIIDCERQGRGFIFENGEDLTSVLEGFTIKNGYASRGGGLYCGGSSPLIRNCVVKSNTASGSGAGGAGLVCGGGACPVLHNCIFSENTAYSGGGAVGCSSSGYPTFKNCVMSMNVAEWGGAICAENFIENSIVIRATNCTFVGNRATYAGSTLGCHSWHEEHPSTVIINNCIIWDGPDWLYNLDNSTIMISYTDIEGGRPGEGNMDIDPLFVHPATDNYHLSADSFCINAGDPDFTTEPDDIDIDGQPRIMGCRVDMGADEHFSDLMTRVGIWPSSFEIALNEDSLVPNMRVLSIRNIGSGTLIWNIAEDCSWLHIEPNQGISTGEADEILIHVGTPQLAPGIYRCDLTINGEDASNSPLIIPMTLHLLSKGVLLVPVQHTTIQSAVDAAEAGETIIVSQGIYKGEGNRNIDFKGKTITVKSMDPNDPNMVAATVINCEGQSRGFHFLSGEDANSILEGFTITNGSAQSGGAIYCDNHSGPTIRNCVFVANQAVNGGGLWNEESNVSINNCIFVANSSLDGGGAIFNYRANMLMTNCTISRNSARFAGGLLNFESNVNLTNCIIWANKDASGSQIISEYGTFSVSHTDVQGGWTGQGNIDVDPCFADPENADYHLKSRAGRWDPNEGGWATDEVTSLCIDAGDPMAPIMHEPFPDGGIINMGAYGGTAEASKSYFGGPVCETIVAGDVNGDCLIDFRDFYLLALHWMEDHNP